MWAVLFENPAMFGWHHCKLSPSEVKVGHNFKCHHWYSRVACPIIFLLHRRANHIIVESFQFISHISSTVFKYVAATHHWSSLAPLQECMWFCLSSDAAVSLPVTSSILWSTFYGVIITLFHFFFLAGPTGLTRKLHRSGKDARKERFVDIADISFD